MIVILSLSFLLLLFPFRFPLHWKKVFARIVVFCTQTHNIYRPSRKRKTNRIWSGREENQCPKLQESSSIKKASHRKNATRMERKLIYTKSSLKMKCGRRNIERDRGIECAKDKTNTIISEGNRHLQSRSSSSTSTTKNQW